MQSAVLNLASRIVYDEIIKDGPKIFRGIFTGDEYSDSYMYGIFTAIEYIAHNAQMTDEFENMFIENMIKCHKEFEKIHEKIKENGKL